MCHVLPWWFFFSLGYEDYLLACWWEAEERLGGLRSSVNAVLPSGRRFEEDTWDQRTWTMSWGVTLNGDEPLFIPLRSPSLAFSPSVSNRSLSGPQAYSLSTTWYIPPCYPPTLLTCYLFPLSHFFPKLFPSGHHKAKCKHPTSEGMSHIITYSAISTPHFQQDLSF